MQDDSRRQPEGRDGQDRHGAEPGGRARQDLSLIHISPKSGAAGPGAPPPGAPRKTAAAGAATPVSGTVSPAKSVPSKPARSPEEEIALRKARRRLHRMLAASLVVVVGLCLAGAGGWYLYQDHQRHMSQVAQLDEALDLIREADETVVALDGIVANPLDAGSLAKADDVLAKLPGALAQLEEMCIRDRGILASMLLKGGLLWDCSIV